MSEQYTCEGCGGTFNAGPDGEARDELDRNFGKDVRLEDCARVCEECYKKLMAQFN